MNAPIPPNLLSQEEQSKRNDLKQRKPYVAAKLANIAAMEERGEISPIIRLEKSYLCNFQCTHCSAEYYMDRHLDKVFKIVDTRSKIDLDDIRRLSDEAEVGKLFRDCELGAVPPVGYGITTIVDDRLEQQPDVYFEAGDHKSLVHMEGSAFSRLTQDARHGRFSEPWLSE